MNEFIDKQKLTECLKAVNLEYWLEDLSLLIDERLSEKKHGDFFKWQQIIRSLLIKDNTTDCQNLFMQLSPWRKGPFKVAGTYIDSEWRSDQKWARIEKTGIEFKEKNILDVGCGNGYFAFKMRDEGAKTVIGIEPMILYIMQFFAINIFKKDSHILILPVRLSELPFPVNQFDITFSMGVLYHQRSPIDHLCQLKKTLKPGGQLVLETLFLQGSSSFASTPEKRYAQMRNTWLIPSVSELKIWLIRSGFEKVKIIDKSVTTINEQRSTEWMTFNSLSDALNPADPDLTIEGWPAPRRILVTANAI
ncbi:MAG: tRNA 5-methoxyuridine(34)/uridine 5-oxyacetic acid(34) synthase CmoB [Gammaproteobacteria bacterium]|nr:tRNA 5-methoxyuridine(34)/uridine 5-oxyacetic acid(34) synthase CmoB [Gammaproteobacteria bacterium]|tara:strand:+ start:1407 stop:2324 length:918 start_codon:yes stop_codon:yes gene_type:complete